MGLGKWQHIEALGKLPSVDSRWQAKFGRPMTAADIDAIYAAFMPLQIAKVVDFSAPIAGVVDTLAALRADGLKTVSYTHHLPFLRAYERSLMKTEVEKTKNSVPVAETVS